MQLRKSLPDIDRLSVVAAAIMLAFALTQIIHFPSQALSFTFLGILVEFAVDFNTIITALTVILAAAGVEWLIQSHPERKAFKNFWEHGQQWIIPMLTALVVGVALNNIPEGLFWWVIFGLGSLLLMAVFIAEYNLASSDEVQHPLVMVGLTGLSFALYLLLAIAVYSSDLRLYLQLPLLGLGALMMISRSLYLRLREWHFMWVWVSTMIVSEIVVSFHYLPLTATQSALFLVGIAYALTSIVSALKEGRKGWSFWAEPIIMLVLMVLVSFIRI
jgi:hypothetical protein